MQWIRRYILFHNRRHPQEMGCAEIEAFLTYKVDCNALLAVAPMRGHRIEIYRRPLGHHKSIVGTNLFVPK
ncbi:MAG: phage integrase N-terminal SAM-like domain-containing protein [Thermodesulfobacteriota bacterium]